MLIPRFTIRALLAVLTVAAVVFLVAGMAVRGETWAWGVTIGVLCAVVTALAHAAWFGLVWLFAQLPTSRRVVGDAAGGRALSRKRPDEPSPPGTTSTV